MTDMLWNEQCVYSSEM